MTIIAVDIDGVLAEKLANGNYPKDYYIKRPIYKSQYYLKILRSQGHKIILYTARFEKFRIETETWLKMNGFEGLYDKLVMEKLQYDLLIDDRAIGFKNWPQCYSELIKFNNVTSRSEDIGS